VISQVLYAQYFEDLPIVDLETIGAAECRLPTPTPDDLALIVYTSGSTGSPKGACHNHRNLLHDVMQQTNTLHLNEEDRVALLYSPAVIAAIREILMTLLNGASLHILSPQKLQPAGLVREIRARGITICRTVPVLLRRVTEALGSNERLDSVRVVGLGSQRVDWSDFDVFRRHFPAEAFLIAGIGATECGGNYCHWFVDDRLRGTGLRLPIGRILPDANVTIVGDDGHPVAIGEVGEFVVPSRYVALGYWHNPDLTARAFMVDPGDPKTRIYKTGDMGRMRSDGLLEYVGRNDQQIKLRGHRIEIGEIELALGECAGGGRRRDRVAQNQDWSAAITHRICGT
jgi:non-ribosomal peptide synthetase component F